MKKITVLSCAILCAGLLCSCFAPSYNINVYLSPELKKQYMIYPSFEVDVVGISQNNKSLYASQTVDDYFHPDSLSRKNLKHVTLHFSEENAAPKYLKKRNGVWELFEKNNVENVGLIVNLPLLETKVGKEDFRKISIPLKNSLFSDDSRYFEITPQGIIQLNKAPEKVTVKPEEDGFLPKEEEKK